MNKTISIPTAVVIIVILAGLIVGGVYAYRHYYAVPGESVPEESWPTEPEASKIIIEDIEGLEHHYQKLTSLEGMCFISERTDYTEDTERGDCTLYGTKYGDLQNRMHDIGVIIEIPNKGFTNTEFINRVKGLYNNKRPFSEMEEKSLKGNNYFLISRTDDVEAIWYSGKNIIWTKAEGLQGDSGKQIFEEFTKAYMERFPSELVFE